MRSYSLTQAALNAVFVCVACGNDGVVRISVTRNPEGSIRRRGAIAAAQWAWVGSESRAKLLLRHLRRQWSQRYVLAEGYRFDYGTEGSAFRDELDRAFAAVVGCPATWEKLGPDALAMLRERWQVARRRRRAGRGA